MPVTILDAPVNCTTAMNFTPSLGASHALILAFRRNSSGTCSPVSAVTLGGQAATLIAGYSSGTYQRSSSGLWAINAIQIAAMRGNTIAATGGSGTLFVFSMSISGASQDLPEEGDFGQVNPAESLSPNLVRSIQTNRYERGLTLAIQHWNYLGLTVTMANPARDFNASDAGSTVSIGYEPDASNGTASSSWTNTFTDRYGSFIAVSFKESTSPIISNVNGGNALNPGVPAAWTTYNFNPAPNAATLDGVACAAVSAGGITPPVYADEQPAPRPGNRTLVGSNGTQSSNASVPVGVPADHAYQTLAGTPNTGNFSVLKDFTVAPQPSDFIVFPSAIDGVATGNEVDPTGLFKTNFDGVQIFWHIRNSNRMAYSYLVETAGGQLIRVTKFLNAVPVRAEFVKARSSSSRFF